MDVLEVQPQSVGDNAEAGKAHGGGTQHGVEGDANTAQKTCCNGNTKGVVP